MVQTMLTVMETPNTTKIEDNNMLNNEKKELLRSMIPKAILKAVTSEAKHAILKRSFGQDIIPIYNYPFKIGREARVEYLDDKIIIQERHGRSGHKPNNDAYLLDNGELLQISREHCSIICNDASEYILQDRESSCGSLINKVQIGGDNHPKTSVLKDGDIITIGSEESKYKFKFILLDTTELSIR